ncbi:MAG: hypothetical protein IJD78_01815 [Clostridia bacterium]|nr:hypothetical protein [Clostridia bacterium]
MKKAISVFAALLLIIAAGCENQRIHETKEPPSLPETFTSKLGVSYAGTEMTAVLTQKSSEEYELRMLTPEILSPLALVYKDGVCTVTYDGLSFETDLNRFPQVSFGALLTETLSALRDGIDIQTTYSDGIQTFRGTGERGIFVITRNAETGAFIELTVEGADLHVVFTDFKALQ